MPKTTNHDPDRDELPGFGQAPIPEPEDLEEDDLLGLESPLASPAPSTTSPSPTPPPAAPGSNQTPSPSTTGSTDDHDDDDHDHDEDLAEGLEFLAGGLFELFGQTMNRMVRVRRRGQRTARWLVSEQEAVAFAEPVARIAERHLPDELKTGDAKDAVIAGSVALEYGVRNMADLDEPPPPQQTQPTRPVEETAPSRPPPLQPAAAPQQAQPSAAPEPEPLVPPSL